MGFSDKLSAAKAAPRPTRDTKVVLDSDVAHRRRELIDAIDNAQKPQADGRLAMGVDIGPLQEELDALEAEFTGSLVTLRFTRMLGMDWAELVIKNPPRQDVLVDQYVGNYNVHAVTRAAAIATGAVVNEDGTTYAPTATEWDDLFNTISGAEFNDVVDTVYALNQGEPMQAVQVALKAQAATRS
jgi:hypothetical protein